MNYLFQTAKPILLDFLSTIVFLIAFEVLHNAALAILLGMAAGVAEIAWQYLRHKRISPMEGMSLFLVLALGGASLITHDPRFVMIKPTLGYGAIGVVMMQPGWQARYAPKIALELVPRARFVAWGYAWAALMWISALGNLALVALVDVKTWGLVLTVWGLSTKFTLFAAEYLSIRWEARRAYIRRGPPPIAEAA